MIETFPSESDASSINSWTRELHWWILCAFSEWLCHVWSLIKSWLAECEEYLVPVVIIKLQVGHTMAQAANHQTLTAEAWVRARISPCQIFGGQIPLGQVSLLGLQFFPVNITPLWLSILMSPGGWTIGPLEATLQIHSLTPSTWTTRSCRFPLPMVCIIGVWLQVHKILSSLWSHYLLSSSGRQKPEGRGKVMLTIETWM
jgi:hypothetical protein